MTDKTSTFIHTDRIKATPHVVIASSEITPFAQTGGLGEVIGSLPIALEKLGLRVSLIMPAYRTVLKVAFKLEDTGIILKVPVGDRTETATVLRSKIGKSVPVYFIRADKYFDRDGLYGNNGTDFSDNAERFVFFSRAILELCKLEAPDILHANDWQTALALAFIKTQPQTYPELNNTRTVFTIHNLGYQGNFWKSDWPLLNMDWQYFTPDYLEFYDKINFLKAGIVFADRITTVSPTYAAEIQTKEFGFGLEGALHSRQKTLTGILNGIDCHDWNPETDGDLTWTYSIDDLTGKARCKIALQKEYGLHKAPGVPVIGWVSRLVSQKGCDLLEEIIPSLMVKNVQFVMLGDGDRRFSDVFHRLPASYPGKAGVHIGFHDLLVRKLIAGSDLLLLPSLYEPCGLTQLYGLRYGTPSVVRATGGLKDSIQEFDAASGSGTGFLFNNYKAGEFLSAVERALSCFARKNDWEMLVKNAMKADFSWSKSAHEYKQLYHKLLSSYSDSTPTIKD